MLLPILKETDKVEDVLSVGDEVDVKLLEIDAKTGKMRLSRRALLEKPEGYVEPERKPRSSSDKPRRDSDRRDNKAPRRDDRRGDRRDNRGPRREFRQDAPKTEEETPNTESEMF